MVERKYLLRGFFFFSFTSLVALLLLNYDLRNHNDVLIDTYAVRLDFGNTLRLKEIYTYEVGIGDKYRMLYRYWNSPLSVGKALNEPSLEFKGFIPTPKGSGWFDWYVKDYRGWIYGNLTKDSLNLVKNLANRNEVGIVNPKYFKEGKYCFGVIYNVYPPLIEDKNKLYTYIVLADKHIHYKRVRIEINDRNGVIEKVFPFMPSYELHKTESGYIVEGYSPPDNVLKLVFSLREANFKAFPTEKDMEHQLKTALIVRSIFNTLKWLLISLAVGFPLIFLLLYWRYGREKFYTVPEYLSYVPNPNRKPWEVNVIFAGNGISGNENAFYSTLLDLQRRGILKIFGGIVKIKNKIEIGSLDEYERKVLDFLLSYGKTTKDGGFIFNVYKLQELLVKWRKEKNREALKKLSDRWNEITSYENPHENAMFDLTGFNRFLWFLLLGFITLVVLFFSKDAEFWRIFSLDTYPFFVASAILTINGFFGLIFIPPYVLGRWKRDYYREKLQWEAFKNFLSDMAMIKKYAPEDLAMWKEWLIYATALGVADKVKRAMEELNIKIPELGSIETLNTGFSNFSGSVSSTSSSSSSGGGFGGGGAGAR